MAISCDMARSSLLWLCASAAALDVSRRALLRSSAAMAAGAIGTSSASAALRGGEDAYATQVFDANVCTKRTPLGACSEQGAMVDKVKPEEAKATAPGGALMAPEDYESSELIRRLRQKTADNAEANAREVKEKTLKNGLAGTFGPFSSEAPIMRPDGEFDIVSLERFDRLKDAGKLTVSKTGLDTYIEGFDPTTFGAKKGGFFGF